MLGALDKFDADSIPTGFSHEYDTEFTIAQKKDRKCGELRLYLHERHRTLVSVKLNETNLFSFVTYDDIDLYTYISQSGGKISETLSRRPLFERVTVQTRGASQIKLILCE